jgi:hypothetical protein
MKEAQSQSQSRVGVSPVVVAAWRVLLLASPSVAGLGVTRPLFCGSFPGASRPQGPRPKLQAPGARLFSTMPLAGGSHVCRYPD